MTCEAHPIRRDLGRLVLVEPARRVWVAPNPTVPVAGHTDRGRALVVTGGTRRDVAPGGLAVEVTRPGEGPSGRVRRARIRDRGRELVQRVAALARARAVALVAARAV